MSLRLARRTGVERIAFFFVLPLIPQHVFPGEILLTYVCDEPEGITRSPIKLVKPIACGALLAGERSSIKFHLLQIFEQ